METERIGRLEMINKKKSHLLSYLFDLLMLFILLVFILLDLLLFKKEIYDYDSNFFNLSSVVVTLVPCIITVISISLSINNEKIYGATLNEINELRGSFYFTFFHMILITCGIVGTYSLLYALNARIGIYCLEFISLIYSIIFSVQVVPLMTRSKWLIKRILKINYLRLSRNNLVFEKESSKIFNTLITNIILTEGICTAFYLLNTEDTIAKDLLNYLLIMQNKFYWDSLEDISVNKLLSVDLYKDISIRDSIDIGYKNIAEFVSNFPETKIALELDTKEYYQITRSIFSLHELCFALGLQKKEKKALNTIISNSSIFPYSNKNNNFGISTIVCMLATTLNEGETWFASFLRDNNLYPNAVFDFEKCPIGIFTCMMINHLLVCEVLNKDEEERLIRLISEPVQGLNADGTSRETLMNRSIEFGKKELVAESISMFLKYYNSVSETTFYFHGTKNRSSYKTNIIFSKKALFHDWLLIIFACSNYDFSKINLEKIFDKLNEEETRILAEELSENWLNKRKLKDDVDITFLKRFIIDLPEEVNADYFDLKIITQLVKFHDSFYKKKYDDFLKNTSISLEESKKIIISKFEEAVSNNPFYDEELSTENEIYRCFQFTIQARDYDKILMCYLDELPNSFIQMINDSLKKEFGDEQFNRKDINDEIVKEIFEFKPEFTSSIYPLRFYCCNKNNKKILFCSCVLF